VALTNSLLRKSPTSSVVEGPPMLRNTIAVGPCDELCVTGWTGVASHRTCCADGFDNASGRNGRIAAGSRRAMLKTDYSYVRGDPILVVRREEEKRCPARGESNTISTIKINQKTVDRPPNTRVSECLTLFWNSGKGGRRRDRRPDHFRPACCRHSAAVRSTADLYSLGIVP
jgi:hypothetical protein